MNAIRDCCNLHAYVKSSRYLLIPHTDTKKITTYSHPSLPIPRSITNSIFLVPCFVRHTDGRRSTQIPVRLNCAHRLSSRMKFTRAGPYRARRREYTGRPERQWPRMIPTNSGGREDSESTARICSAEDSLAIQIEIDHSWSASSADEPPTFALVDDVHATKQHSADSLITLADHHGPRRVQSYHGLSMLHHHVSSLVLAPHYSSMRITLGTLTSSSLRMSTLSPIPVPSPSCDELNHPTFRPLCHSGKPQALERHNSLTPAGPTISDIARTTSRRRKRATTSIHTQ